MERQFETVSWIYNSNIYEVNVRQYTAEGTFDAFALHLPRLKEMGVEVLWFMPITPISKALRQGTLGSYYACSDYKAINPEFGTLKDFKNLVKKAHSLGFKVIIDWVANHTGGDHIWTNSHPEYYKKDINGEFYDLNGWHDVIDLNYYDAGMRKAMIDAMCFWVKECDLDGFRCDMAHLVPLDFWEEARKKLNTLKPSLFFLAETGNLDYLRVFDSFYGWTWMHETEQYAKGQANMFNLTDVLKNYQQHCPPYTFPMFFTTNHDENSWNGTEYEKYGEGAHTLAVFNSTWLGIPMVYSGQELPNKKRLKFFDKDVIEWNGQFELHDFYKTLLQFRKEHPVFTKAADTDPVIVTNSQPQFVLSYSRQAGEREIVVVLNLSAHQLPVTLSKAGEYTSLFNRQQVSLSESASFDLPAWGYLVLHK